MPRVSTYLPVMPDLLDYLLMTDVSNNKKTTGVTVQSLIQLINSVNGMNSLQFNFSDGSNPDITYSTPGAFFTGDNELSPENITSLIFNKNSLFPFDVSPLFERLSEIENTTIKLDNPEDPNNFMQFNIQSIDISADYVTLNVEAAEGFFLGDFMNNKIYSVYFGIASKSVDNIMKRRYIVHHSNTISLFEIVTLINSAVTINFGKDDVPPMIIVFHITSQGVFTYKFLLADIGRGIYGQGGTPLTIDDIEQVFSGIINIEDVINDPETDFFDLGDITGTNVSNVVNIHIPPLTFQPFNEGLVVIRVVNNGINEAYLFLGIGGVYGLGASQTTMADFELFQNGTVVITRTSQLINDGDGNSPFVTEDNLDIRLNDKADITDVVLLSQVGVPSGVPSLDGNGKVPLSQINDALLGNVKWYGLYNGTIISSSPIPALNGQPLPLPSASNIGWYFIAEGDFNEYKTGDWLISNGITWNKVDNTDAVSSVAGLTGNVSVENLRIALGNVTQVSIQDQAGTQQFLMTSKLRFKGATFDAVNEMISIDSFVPFTVFINSVTGSDVTGQIENKSKPFKTDAAAYAALPANDGTTWKLLYVCTGNVTRTMGANFPARDLIIECLSTGGTFDFSSRSGSNTAATSLRINIPKCTFRFVNAADSCLGATGVFELYAAIITLSVGTGVLTNIGFFRGQTGSATAVNYVKCATFTDTSGTQLIGFNGTLEVTGTMNLPSTGALNGNGGDIVILIINTIAHPGTGTYSLLGGNGATGEIKLKAVTGAGTINMVTGYERTMNYDLTGLNVASTVILSTGSTINRAVTKITGVLNKNSAPLRILQGKALTFNNFEGKVEAFSCALIDLKAFNSTFYVANELINGPTISSVEFSGVVTIVQTTPDYLIKGLSAPVTLLNYGDIKTNALSYGKYVNMNSITSTFKEKSKEIVVRDKMDLVNKTLDSDLNYIIDGTITLGATDYIEVPVGGLSISGYGFDVSEIKATSNGSTIFKSPVGGCGNIFIANLSIEASGTGSKVFDCTNAGDVVGGADAVELNVVNFDNCTSLGNLVNFRQGLWNNVGIFGVKDGLTLDGVWSGGFRADLVIVRNFGTVSVVSTLFKAGASLLFKSRFITDINADFKTDGSLSNFVAGNFFTTNLFQIKGAQITRAGVIDPTQNYTGTITATDDVSDWAGNNGIKNSYLQPYGFITSSMSSFADDAAAAIGGISVGEVYIESSTGYFKKRLA